MSRVKASLDHKRIRRLIWLVLTVFVLSGYSLQGVAESAYYSMVMQAYGTVSEPPVILKEGNCSGTSTIYTNKTSAKVNVTAPLFDYVDNDDSDVDSSADKGTHSNFTAQQYGPDSTYDRLTEQDTAVVSVALIVGDPGSPSATQDVPFCSHINARAGWTATYLAASPLPDVSGYDLVEITYSVGTSPDFSSWKTLAKPIFIHDRRHTDDIALTTGEGSYASSSTTINITVNTHYITQPYSIGNLVISSSTYLSYPSGIAGDVDVLATLPNQPTQPTLIEVDAGETLSDGVTSAPERRVYYPPAQYDATTLNSDGWDIFDRAIDWLVRASASAVRVTYDFVGINNPSSSHKATGGEIDVSDPQDPPPSYEEGTYATTLTTRDLSGDSGYSGTELTSAQYDLIESSNDTRYQVPDPELGDNAFLVLEFYINEDISNISQIDVLYEGYQAAATDKLWLTIWNYYYSRHHVLEASQHTSDHNYVGSITSNIGHFINSADGQVTIVAFNEDTDDSIFCDYVKIVITCPNYELDLEAQWTSADYDETNEELCIYAYEGSNTHSLDATDGYMIIGDGTPDWGSVTGTISFWIKWDTVGNRPWGQHDNMETRFSGANLVVDWGAATQITSSTSFTDGKWYFIAIVWDENTDDLYLYVGDRDNPPTQDTYNNAWGSTVSTVDVTQNNFMASKNGIDPTDGHGEELRYWNIDRTLAEIQSDYDTELTGSETNLRSYFKLNNNFDDIGPDNNDGSGSGSYSFSSDAPFDWQPAENIRVDFWNGTAWQNLFTNLTNGWNNVSVSPYLDSSTFTIRFKGDNETSDTDQDSWNIDATLLHVWTVETYDYDYVLKIVNQVEDKSWEVKLQVYDNSSISRLSNTTISIRNTTTTSDQIIVSGGTITQSEGSLFDLPEGVNETLYIKMSNVKATTTDTSYLYAHLKIQAPDTSTYSLYVITFEIT